MMKTLEQQILEMTIIKLREMLEMKAHNLLCYSKDLFNTIARDGFESQFQTAKIEYDEVLMLVEYYTSKL